MAAPSAQTLQRLAGDTGHQPGTLEKVLRLLDLLQEISQDPTLSDRLALKGGTALNLFSLTASERAFLDGMLDRGEIDADLLDIAPEIHIWITNTPMLAWKTRHVRKHRGLQD